MPTLPAPLAAASVRLFGTAATVGAVDDPSPGLRRVLLHGAGLAGKEVTPGCEVEFLVDDRHFRHYSPCGLDGGELAILFHRPTPGPGGRWVDGLHPGAELEVLGPGRARSSPRPLRRRTVLLGDASALGVLGWLAADARSRGVPVRGAVEVPAADVDAARAHAGGLDVIAAGAAGAALHGWLASVVPSRGEQVVCVGHAQSLQSLRADLVARGVPRRDVLTRAYWSTGRTGL